MKIANNTTIDQPQAFAAVYWPRNAITQLRAYVMNNTKEIKDSIALTVSMILNFNVILLFILS